MPSRIYNNNNNQVAYAHYVGNAPTAPSDIYNVSIESEADTIPSTYGSVNTPIVIATPVGKVHPRKTTQPPFSQALNTPATTSTHATTPTANSRPPRPNTTTTTTTTAQPPPNSITGNELLRLMKQNRKRDTVRAGILWGTVGFLILGPIGAVALGAGLAVSTKSTLKREERILRQELESQGALGRSVAVPVHLRRY